MSDTSGSRPTCHPPPVADTGSLPRRGPTYARLPSNAERAGRDSRGEEDTGSVDAPSPHLAIPLQHTKGGGSPSVNGWLVALVGALITVIGGALWFVLEWMLGEPPSGLVGPCLIAALMLGIFVGGRLPKV